MAAGVAADAAGVTAAADDLGAAPQPPAKVHDRRTNGNRPQAQRGQRNTSRLVLLIDFKFHVLYIFLLSLDSVFTDNELKSLFPFKHVF